MRLLSVSLVVILFLAAVGAQYQAPQGQGETAADILRLHIRAPSDDPEDQELKLLVRDAVLAVLTPELCTVASPGEATRRVADHLEELAGAAREVLRGKGKEYPISLGLGQSYFPDRSYGNSFFPAGEYQALQIIIGEGLGANWWCVLFPPLCLVEGTRAKAAEEEGEGIIAGEGEEAAPSIPEIRFKIVEWWQKLTE